LNEPFFIMGCRRSGTTLVSRILDSHSRLASYHESYFYNIFRPELRWYGDLARDSNLERLLKDVEEILRMQGVEPPPRDALRRAMPSRSLAGVLHALLRLYAESQGKLRGGDKTPEHHAFLGEILEQFPASPVLFLMRDPRDTVLSIQRSFGHRAEEGARLWNAALADLKRAPRPVHVVRYEELARRPAEVVREICGYLGEAYEESMLSFFEKIPEQWQKRPGGEKLGKPVDAGSVGAFRDKMSAADVAAVESICASGMEEMGYGFVGARPAVARAPLARPRRPLPALLVERLVYYGFNRERWRRGMARWRLMARVRAHYFLASLAHGRRSGG
jgi:hypothetical protein